MKKNGIRVVLALVLCLVMILGMGGVAEAGPPPPREFTVDVTLDNVPHLQVSLNWNRYRSYGYHLDFYQSTGTDWIWKGDCHDEFASLHKTGSIVVEYTGADCDVDTYDVWKVEARLLKKNYSVGKRPATSDTIVVSP